jgi:hypothetical protein
MRTEIQKSYKSGFLLSEQELRRILQACNDHGQKVGIDPIVKLTAKLKDGALVETSQADEILALENEGNKAITRLSIQYGETGKNTKAHMHIIFEDGRLNQKNWTSVSLEVVGDSRDAVFVAAADLDERIKKTRSLSWSYLLSHPLALIAPLVVGMLVSSFIQSHFMSTSESVNLLESRYRAGTLKNPIEAMIFLERARSAHEGAFIPLAAFASAFSIYALLSFPRSRRPASRSCSYAPG